MNPSQASQSHIDIFTELQSRYRDLFAKLSQAIEVASVKNALIDEKLAEAERLKKNAESLENIASMKNVEAAQNLEHSKSIFKDAKLEENRLAEIKKDQDLRDLALSKQREEAHVRDQEINEKIKWAEMLERVVKTDRIKVEQLIRDNKLKYMIAEDAKR